MLWMWPQPPPGVPVGMHVCPRYLNVCISALLIHELDRGLSKMLTLSSIVYSFYVLLLALVFPLMLNGIFNLQTDSPAHYWSSVTYRVKCIGFYRRASTKHSQKKWHRYLQMDQDIIKRSKTSIFEDTQCYIVYILNLVYLYLIWNPIRKIIFIGIVLYAKQHCKC